MKGRGLKRFISLLIVVSLAFSSWMPVFSTFAADMGSTASDKVVQSTDSTKKEATAAADDKSALDAGDEKSSQETKAEEGDGKTQEEINDTQKEEKETPVKEEVKTDDSKEKVEKESEKVEEKEEQPEEETKTEEKKDSSEEKKTEKKSVKKGLTAIDGKQGAVSGADGWVWKITGSEGDYTLTFEYTGSAETPPAFEVPNNFISGILEELGEGGKDEIKEIIIPEGCTRIGTYAFQNMDGVERVEIASTVKTIDNVAFGDNNNDTDAPLGCAKLKEVDIKLNADGKSDLQYIGARAFNGCKKLETLDLENTKLYYVGYGGLMNTAIESITLPDTIATSSSGTIGQYAFARNPNLKSVNMPATFYIYSVNTYTFSDCTALENVKFREVQGGTIRNSTTYLAPNYAFQNDSSLRTLDFSAWDKNTRYTYCYLTSSMLSGSSLKDIEQIILPKNKTVYIESSAFSGKRGMDDLDILVNPESVGTIGSSAFYNTRLKDADLSDFTNLTSIGANAFDNCSFITEAVIPEKVTSIGANAFRNNESLEEFTLNARSLTSADASIFMGDDNLKTVTISDNTKTLTGNFLAAIPKDADVFFEGENIITINKATQSGGEKPLKNLSGKYYVDSQGVLYSITDDGKASLAYVPPGITSYTVPEKFTATDGKEYTVVAMNNNAVRLADDLQEITFEKPENVYLKSSAFSGWSKSDDNMGKKVNGLTEIDPEQWNKVSETCDFPIKDPNSRLVPTVEDSIKDSDGKDILKTIVAVNKKTPSEDGTYDYLTSQPATYTIAISNEDNVVMTNIVRIYFSYSDSGYLMGSFPEGTYPIENSTNGSIYRMDVVQTDNPDVYYYELTGIKPGETLVFQNDIQYPSPLTSGGQVKVWTKTLSQEEAEATRGEVINPTDYLELDWETKPVEFTYTKTNANMYSVEDAKLQSPIIKTDPSGDAYVYALAYRLTEANKGSSSTSEGQDHIRWVEYEDEITLPEELYWREEIVEAINSGNWDVENTTTHYDYNSNSTLSCKAITVTAGGKKYYLAYILPRNGYGYSNIENFKPEITSSGNLRLKWKVNNTSLSGPSSSNEYAVHSFFLRIGDSVLLADLDKVNELLEESGTTNLKDVLKIHNKTEETRHYSYSPNQTAESEVDSPVDANYQVNILKEYRDSSNTSHSYIYAGRDEFFNLIINNTGILNLSNWGKPSTDPETGQTVYDGKNIITDNISYTLYIEPNNIEAMFGEKLTVGAGKNAQTVYPGNWLTLTINKASLFTEDLYQVQDGEGQNNKYTADSASNIAYGNDANKRVLEAATIIFRKNSEGKLEAILSGDTKSENNRSYIIGEGGDYASIKDFFTAIGFMPTYGTTYAVNYSLRDGEEFTLKPGQNLTIPLRTSYKTTPMMLRNDERWYHSTYSISTQNAADFNLQVGSEQVSRRSTTTYHYWQRELFMYKYGYVEGSSSQITNNTYINDGSTVDAYLQFYNYSNKPYEHINIADFMMGPQVALAPVNQNQGLKAPDGSDLETYESSGVTYYLLNKPGEYKNVVFGGTGRTATQSYRADITVTQKSDGLDTLFKWNPDDNNFLNNWGSTSTSSYIYYKVLVSASKANLVDEDNPGEAASYLLNNKAWLGDHQGHRLYDYMGIYSQIYGINKYILTKDARADGTDTVAEGHLVKDSRIRHDDKVTYQIELSNISDGPAVLNGTRIRDELPKTYGIFDWTKGVNVTNLRYFADDGVEIKYGSADIPTDGEVGPDGYWSIDKNSSGVHVIKWDRDFNIHFPANSKVKILVDLSFPSRPEDGASTWDQYVAANKGANLQNTFYLDTRYSSVDHVLESEGKAVLYKGVYDTGLTTHRENSSTSYYTSYYTNNSRLMYQNGTGPVSSITYSDYDLKASTVTYYTVLYNGSYDRLYLSDLQDQLPKGFYFQSMCNTALTTTYQYNSNTSTSSTAYSSTNYTGYHTYYGTPSTSTISEGYNNSSYKLVTINNAADEYDSNTVKYINARVDSQAVMGSDGRQHLTFTIKGSPSSANGSGGVIKYDSAVGKYYLNPGEAVRFGYNVLVDEYAKTDDTATNTVTMPYYDYYQTGFNNAADLGTVQSARAVSGITPNDGGCVMMNADDVKDQFGVDTSKYTDTAYSTLEKGNYMVSSVSLERAPITPGMQKTIGGLTTKVKNPSATTIQGSDGSSLYGSAYQGGAKTSDVINWKLRIFNEAAQKNEDAGGMMMNYTVKDTMDSPYKFTGRVYYNMYKNNTRVTYSTQYLFTIGSRTDNQTSVRFASGSSLSASGYRNVRIGSAEDDSDDDWFQFGSGQKSGKVKLEVDKNGQEILTIQMTGAGYAIPAGYWMDMCVHTMYPNDTVVLSDQKYNDVILYPEQDYEASNVSQGRARTVRDYDEDGNPIVKNDGIQSGASIMITQGYTTSSYKQITEIGNTSNTARSDEPKNYIALSENGKTFRYDLHVMGPEAVMSRIVIIDDLPHEGDHSAFVEKDKRFSEFEVGFLAEDLSLRVALKKKGASAETVLSPEQYDAYITTKTEFNTADWDGAGTGWTKISDLSGDELKEALEEAKSIRVVIKDANAWTTDTSKYMMDSECEVHIGFNARITDKDADPGMIAWNSFGYRYQVPLTQNGTEASSTALSLEAQPLNVGIKYPCAPQLKKILTEEVTEEVEKVDEETGETTIEEVTKVIEREAEKDMRFRFLVYEGDPIAALNDAQDMEDKDVVEAISSAGRKYVYVPYEIKQGETAKTLGLWKIDRCYEFDSETEEFVETDTPWSWSDSKNYTLVELRCEDYYYDLDSITISGNSVYNNNRVFTNDTSDIIPIVADNRYRPKFIDLEIGKSVTEYNDSMKDGNVTLAFKVTAKNKKGKVILETYAGLTLDKDHLDNTVTVKDIPNYKDVEITVEEVYTAGYTPDENVKKATYDADRNMWVVHFDNENPSLQHGSGVVNKYDENQHVKKGTITEEGGKTK